MYERVGEGVEVDKEKARYYYELTNTRRSCHVTRDIVRLV